MGAEVETIRIEGSLLEDLYVRHADEALRLSYLLTGDVALAEDLVQDAFVRVAGRLLHLRDPGGFHAYLRKTIVNLARSHYRRRAVDAGPWSGRPRHPRSTRMTCRTENASVEP
jgi:RNA polymerase sigma factor (sigma-70 family)